MAPFKGQAKDAEHNRQEEELRRHKVEEDCEDLETELAILKSESQAQGEAAGCGFCGGDGDERARREAEELQDALDASRSQSFDADRATTVAEALREGHWAKIKLDSKGHKQYMRTVCVLEPFGTLQYQRIAMASTPSDHRNDPNFLAALRRKDRDENIMEVLRLGKDGNPVALEDVGWKFRLYEQAHKDFRAVQEGHARCDACKHELALCRARVQECERAFERE